MFDDCGEQARIPHVHGAAKFQLANDADPFDLPAPLNLGHLLPSRLSWAPNNVDNSLSRYIWRNYMIGQNNTDIPNIERGLWNPRRVHEADDWSIHESFRVGRGKAYTVIINVIARSFIWRIQHVVIEACGLGVRMQMSDHSRNVFNRARPPTMVIIWIGNGETCLQFAGCRQLMPYFSGASRRMTRMSPVLPTNAT